MHLIIDLWTVFLILECNYTNKVAIESRWWNIMLMLYSHFLFSSHFTSTLHNCSMYINYLFFFVSTHTYFCVLCFLLLQFFFILSSEWKKITEKPLNHKRNITATDCTCLLLIIVDSSCLPCYVRPVHNSLYMFLLLLLEGALKSLIISCIKIHVSAGKELCGHSGLHCNK